MKRINLLLTFLFFPVIIFSQIDRVYTNLDSALIKPENVYHLDLQVPLSETVSKAAKDEVKMTELSSNIGLLINLSTLNLKNNRLKSLPESMSNLKNLRELDLSYNDIDTLDNWLPVFASMGHNKLDLTGNPLSIIVQTNIGATNLHEVIVDDCIKLSGSEFCKLGKIRGLRVVSAQNCGIRSLPDLSMFYTVKVLDLTGNLLTDLPKTIAKMRHLVTLKLANNKLSALPERCGQSIRRLYLSNNRLRDFPLFWLGYSGLDVLKLDNNLLEKLPEGMTGKSFNEITFNNNPFPIKLENQYKKAFYGPDAILNKE